MPTEAVSRSSSHMETLDGMRGIAAIMVVYLHATLPFFGFRLAQHGALAVDFFFCLSGFVVALAYKNKLLTSMPFKDFFWLRMQRLYPMVLFGNALGCIVVVSHFIADPRWVDNPLSASVIILLNFALVPSLIGLRADWPPIFPINPPMWSLFFELVANFIYAKAVRALSQPLLVILTITFAGLYIADLTVGGPVGRSVGLAVLPDGSIRVGFSFLMGVYLFGRVSPNRRRTDGRVSLLLMLVLIAILTMPTSDQLAPWFECVAVIAAFPALVFFGAQMQPSARLSGTFLYLGRLSYPLYAIHAPIIRLLSNPIRSVHPSTSLLMALVILEVICCILAAVVVSNLYDEPVRRWLYGVYKSRGTVTAGAIRRNADRTFQTRITTKL